MTSISSSARIQTQTPTMTDDILNDINDHELSHYQKMLSELGAFPDKVLINTLSMIAQDYATGPTYTQSATKIYHSIRSLLLSTSVPSNHKLPLVYVIDSILKNVGGQYISIILNSTGDNDGGGGIGEWMTAVHTSLQNDDTSRNKLRKVWNTWKEYSLFPIEEWKKMGKCFFEEDSKTKTAKVLADQQLKAIGIEGRDSVDGTLMLSPRLRRQMQIVLDEMQSGEEVQELDKVSLERLADINIELLGNIKKAADQILAGSGDDGSGETGTGGSSMSNKSMQSGTGGGTSGNTTNSSTNNLFFELRSPEVLKRCADWEKVDLDHITIAKEICSKLQQHVQNGISSPAALSPAPAASTIKLLGSGSVTATHLNNLVERFQKLDTNKPSISSFQSTGASSLYGPTATRMKNIIDKSKFTNEGLKEKNESSVACLYYAGMPHLSTSDGRRFSSEIELSKHLDNLFRKKQLEKAMEATLERGWYQSDPEWSGLRPASNGVLGSSDGVTAGFNDDDGDFRDDTSGVKTTDDKKSATVTADESRGNCVICGANFKMDFDQEEGEWKYSNCREIEVMYDDASEMESENMLVHVTCHRGLGSPEFLTMDQIVMQ